MHSQRGGPQRLECIYPPQKYIQGKRLCHRAGPFSLFVVEKVAALYYNGLKRGVNMGKEVKTNAMRILDRNKVDYEINLYECKEFVDAIDIADRLGQDYDSSFKTLVTLGKSGEHYVFVLPIARELDLKKAAVAVGEKSVSMIPVKDITALTGYVRGGCTALGMKKNFRTVIDQTAREFDKIIISGGRIGAQIILSPEDLKRVARAEFCDILF